MITAHLADVSAREVAKATIQHGPGAQERQVRSARLRQRQVVDMPHRPKTPCWHPGCGLLVDGGRCDAHRKEARVSADRRKPGERRAYDTARWRNEIRPAQLREQPLCEDCLALGIVTAATDVDHRDGDQWNAAPENLRSLCHKCHSTKTALHDGAFGKPAKRAPG